MDYAVSLGADHATWLRSQFVRLPDGLRQNGKRQITYDLDPGKAVEMNDPQYTPEERDAWDRYLEGQGPDPSGEKTPGKSIAAPSPQVSPEIIPPTALSSQESGPESFAPAANPKPEEPEASRAPPKNQSKPRKRDPAYVLQDILGPPEAKFVPGEQNDGEEPEEALAPEALHPAL